MPDNNFDACNEKSLTKCFPLPKQVFCLKNKPSKFAAASKEKRVDVARAWLFWTCVSSLKKRICLIIVCFILIKAVCHIKAAKEI